MAKRRVFISSVMRDYADFRQAAKTAVRSLHQEPVMAEEFGAKPYSSQVACLEGVRSSDIFVGLFGPRYGHVGPSGVSVSEEEFDEARRRGIPIICFVQVGEKEPRQQQFVERVTAYDAGYFVDFFAAPLDLTPKIVAALHSAIDQPDVATLDLAGAAAHLDAYQWGGIGRQSSDTWFGAALFPERQGEEYISATELGGGPLQDRLLQPALFGTTAILQPRLGTVPEETETALAFVQRTPHGQIVARLGVACDGTLAYGLTLGQGSQRRDSLSRQLIIDEEEVRQTLARFFAYADQFYRHPDRAALVSALYFGASLTGNQFKAFGHPPREPAQGIAVPMHQLQDPLHIPARPLKIARADLGDAARLSRRVVELIARAFRVANAYRSAAER